MSTFQPPQHFLMLTRAVSVSPSSFLSLSLSQQSVTPLQKALITAHNKVQPPILPNLSLDDNFFLFRVLFALTRAQRCQRKCRGWNTAGFGGGEKMWEGNEERVTVFIHSFRVTISWTASAEHFSSLVLRLELNIQIILWIFTQQFAWILQRELWLASSLRWTEVWHTDKPTWESQTGADRRLWFIYKMAAMAKCLNSR